MTDEITSEKYILVNIKKIKKAILKVVWCIKRLKKIPH